MMHKLTIYKILRTLVCLLLICCILINCSPIRANASAVIGGVVAGKAAAGILGWLFSAAMGVVFTDITLDLLTGIGNDVIDHVGKLYGDDEETTNVTTGFWSDLSYTFGGGDDGTGNGSGNDNDDGGAGLTHLPTAILVGLIDWVTELINGDGVEVEGEAAPEGYAYYNSVMYHSLPAEVDSFNAPFVVLCIDPVNPRLFHSANPFVLRRYSDTYLLISSSTCWTYQHNTAGWSYLNQGTGNHSSLKILWSSHDLRDESTGEVVIHAGSYSLCSTETVAPSTYVGDIPQQVQDGTFDEEKYELPYINYGQIFQGQTDAVTALNNVATQLADQTMTYEQYMEQIKTEVDTGGSGDDSGNTSTGPVPEMLPYALDLTDFFPFCIPFDLYDFFSALIAEPEAPKFHWEFQDLSGRVYEIDVDLSPWNSLAATFRSMQLLLFIVGLAVASRKFIKW